MSCCCPCYYTDAYVARSFWGVAYPTDLPDELATVRGKISAQTLAVLKRDTYPSMT